MTSWCLVLLFYYIAVVIALAVPAPSELHFTIEPSDVLARRGQEVRFDCAVSGAETPTVHWRRGGVPLDAIGSRIRIAVRGEAVKSTAGEMTILLSRHLEVRCRRRRLWQISNWPHFLLQAEYHLQNGSLIISRAVELDSIYDSKQDVFQCVAVVGDHFVLVSRKARLKLIGSVRFVEEPYDRQVPVSSNVVLPCRIQGPIRPTVVTWLKDDLVLKSKCYIHFVSSRIIMPAHICAQVLHTFSTVELPRLTVGTESGSLEIRNVQYSDQGVYKCQVKLANGANATVSQPGRLIILPKDEEHELRFEAKPISRTVAVGSSVDLICVVNGHPKPKVIWLKDQKELSLNSRRRIIGESSLLISDVSVADSGTYTCKASNSLETVESSAALEVNEAPKAVITPRSTTGKSGSDVIFRCDISGYPPPAVTWLKNGEIIKSSEYFIISGSQLKIAGLVKNDQGVYQCMADNDVGSAQASAILLVEEIGNSFLIFFFVFLICVFQILCGTLGTTPRLFVHDAPSEPTGLKAVQVSSRYVHLQWDTPMAGGQSLSGYSIYYKSLDAQRERQVNCTVSDSRGFTVSGLAPEKTYFFRVVPVVLNGYGPSSPPLTVITAQEKTVPASVQNLKAYPLSSTSIQIEWDPPLTVAHDPINFYKIFYSFIDSEKQLASDSAEVNLDEEEEIEIQSRNTMYTLHGVEEDTVYRFRVEAVRLDGTSVASVPVHTRSFTDRPSAPPEKIEATALTSDRIMVRWAPPPAKERNGDIVAYKIRFKLKDRGSKSYTIHVDGPNTEYTISDLEPGATYMVRVAAVTVNGTGPYSIWTEVVTAVFKGEESQVPGAPTSLRLMATGNEIKATWTPPLDDGNVVRGFLIGWGINMPDIHTERVSGNVRSFTIANLKPNKDYVVSLKAYNKLGNGFPIYETVRTGEPVSTDVIGSVETPIGLRAQTLSSTAVTLSWTDRDVPLSHQRATDNRYYTIRYTSHYVSGGRYRYVNTSDTNYMIDGLKPDTQYEFSVKASLGRAESEWSMTAFNKTFSSAPSSAPRDLTPIDSDSDPTTVLLNWQPPKHPNGKITKYLIYYTLDQKLPDSKWMVEGIRGDRMSTTIDGLIPDTDYYFKIQAVNDRGYGPVSSVKLYQAKKLRALFGMLKIIIVNFIIYFIMNQLIIFFFSTNTDANAEQPFMTVPSKGEASGPGYAGLPRNVLNIVIAVVVASLAILLVISICCYYYQQKYARRRGYTAGVKKTPRDAKPPPDLWIHHDHALEMRGLDRKGSLQADSPSLHEQLKPLKSCRTPSPPASGVDMPRYQSLAGGACRYGLGTGRVSVVQPLNGGGSLSRKCHHVSSNSVDAVGSPRAHAICSSKLLQSGMNLPHLTAAYTASKQQPAAAQCRLMASNIESGECMPLTSNDSLTTKAPAASTAEARIGCNPLKSFTVLAVPPPPPPPTGSLPSTASGMLPNSTTATGSRIQLIRPNAAAAFGASSYPSPRSRAESSTSMTGAKGVLPSQLNNHSPNVSHQRMTDSTSDTNNTSTANNNNASTSTRDVSCEVTRSYSTEELTAQIQNLDNLMQDLNAISANEFDM
ncbi:Neogenin -like protein [Trichinella britovi]|uniref:Neogenin-like protein n=1 Tax=Trichinella britovi TaxID=45882 RepID=A0A0V1D5B9_TRIBR|nr:Neogenin -like protein [Trichinella britovi]